MDAALRAEMNAAARDFVNAQVDYQFTERERRALAPFFSNDNRKVFFLSGLPESVVATLLAMYSRLKNSRGLRGHFVDQLVPILMIGGLDDSDESLKRREVKWKLYQKEFRARGLHTLDEICDGDVLWGKDFETFVDSAAKPDYWRIIADSPRIKDFKDEHLDKYGHNSIARPARLLLCAERVSIQVAKILEETWPGTAFIELSSRYVDFGGKSQYPVWTELALINAQLGSMVRGNIEASVDEYRRLMGEKFDGPFPKFLRAWATELELVTDAKDLESGIIGEACDVLGNLLPCSTLTELGLAVSGEAVGQMLKNLRLEGSPECVAVAQLIEDETERAGHSYFLRHHEPTPWEIASWVYLEPANASFFDSAPYEQAKFRILAAYGMASDDAEDNTANFSALLAGLKETPRGEFDKLPKQFRGLSVMAQDVMSYRSWRDLQRQSLSVHFRSRVTPELGFYEYPKAWWWGLDDTFRDTHARDKEIYILMRARHVPPELAEYVMAMGNLVTYQITSDLRQAEFCGWQRSKWGVNDEVRQSFLKIEHHLRGTYPWWAQLSRADLTPHYVFARGSSPVVLP